MQLLEIAKKELAEPDITCVIIKGEKIIRSKEHGIRPLLRLLRESPESLQGAFVADKIVGKAAAMLMIYGKISGVYAAVISRPAVSVFTEYAVPFRFDQKEDFIQNRDRSGMCPMESKTMSCSTPEEAYRIFSEIIPKG